MRRPSDLTGCVAALAVVHRTDQYPVRWPAHPEAWLSPDGTVAAWVAESADAIVGHVLIKAGADPRPAEAIGLSPERLASVSRLFVTPPARGAGVATTLLAHAATEAAGRGLRLVLDVAENGAAAIGMYERAGWTRVLSTPVDWLTTNGRPGLVHHYLSPAPQL